MKILHTADWHPKSHGTMGGKVVIDPETGLGLSLTDFRNSLLWLWHMIEEHEPDVLVIAGDVFDHPTPNMDELRAVLEFFSKMEEADCRSVVIPGNHDSPQSGTGTAATWPVGLTGVHYTAQPHSFTLKVKDQSLRIDCLPYPSRGRLLATTGLTGLTPEEINAEVNVRLKEVVQGFALVPPGDVNLLVAHGSVSTAMINEQPRSLAHDILIPLECRANYDLVLLGHIHQAQNLHGNAYYSGSLLRQSFGEEKEQKGVYLHEVEWDQWKSTFLENPHARTYRTLSLDEMVMGWEGDLSHIYRLKDRCTEDVWRENAPLVNQVQSTLPMFQVQIEIERPDRQRDSTMTAEMSPDQALERCLEKDSVTDPLLTQVRNIHRELMGRDDETIKTLH